MTLFEEWRKANNKAPLPAYLQQHENPYLQCLKLATVNEDSFAQKQERRVLAWYEKHPECRQLLLPLDWRGVQMRSSHEYIDITERFGHGWFDKVSGGHERPEQRLKEVDSLDNALAMAAALNSDWHKREILDEYPLEMNAEGKLVNRRKKKKAEKPKQLVLDLRV